MPFTSSAHGGFSVNPPMPCLFFHLLHMPFCGHHTQTPSIPNQTKPQAPHTIVSPHTNTKWRPRKHATPKQYVNSAPTLRNKGASPPHSPPPVPTMMITHTNSDSAHHHLLFVLTPQPQPQHHSPAPCTPHPQTHKPTKTLILITKPNTPNLPQTKNHTHQ